MAGSFFDDGDCLCQCLAGIAFVKAADVVKNFFSPDPAFCPNFNPPQFTVEYVDSATVEKGHVVFNDDVLIFEGTARMGHQQRGFTEPAQVIFPDRLDIAVKLPVSCGLIR